VKSAIRSSSVIALSAASGSFGAARGICCHRPSPDSLLKILQDLLELLRTMA
jgi:hypothetical protein